MIEHLGSSRSRDQLSGNAAEDTRVEAQSVQTLLLGRLVERENVGSEELQTPQGR